MTSKKTAAIYDRWLFTLGGGEQVVFAYAEVLRDLGYKTTLLSHTPIDKEKAEKKMGVNLTNIELKVLPLISSKELSEYTEKYDLFMNSSYLDYFANRSKYGILSIFFPSQIYLSPYEFLKRAVIVPSFSNFFIYPSHFEGFRFDEFKKGMIYKWLSPKSSIIFNKNVRTFSLTFFCRTMSVSLIDGIQFDLDGQIVEPKAKRISEKSNQVLFIFSVEELAKKRFTITLPDTQYAKDVALIRLTIHNYRYFLYNAFKKYFPKWEMRLHGGPGVTKLSDLDSYQKIVTISEFSKFWIKKYWGLDSTVVYPPVQLNHFSGNKKKKNWIAHVGRFFVTGHNKKQLELIKAFRKMVNEGKNLDWELHLVGSVAEGQKHQEYFDQCQYYAQGYPIFFHTDVPFTELKLILESSKIYWHATGLGEDEKSSPILFEHFGITTVEAMAAGCVPVVIKAGGQKEIVTKEAGFLWSSIDELIEYTEQLIRDKNLLEKMRLHAVERAKFFDQSQFKSQVKKMIQKISATVK